MHVCVYHHVYSCYEYTVGCKTHDVYDIGVIPWAVRPYEYSEFTGWSPWAYCEGRRSGHGDFYYARAVTWGLLRRWTLGAMETPLMHKWDPGAYCAGEHLGPNAHVMIVVMMVCLACFMNITLEYE